MESVLVKKINRLIEKNQDLDSKIYMTKEEIELTRKEIKKLNMELLPQELKMDEESQIFLFLKDFYIIAKKIVEDAQFITYTYETKNSGDYYKIERAIYEEYICKYSKLDLKKYMKYCIDLRLVKSENGKVAFASGRKTVYYVSKAFIDAANRDENQED